MEQIISRPVRQRRTVIQIGALLAEFEKSKVGIGAFCTTHNICKATFHKWCSRYKFKSGKKNKPAGFAALQITPSPVPGSATLFAEVQGIKIYQPVAARYLKELITV